MSLEEEILREKREDRLVDFAFSGLLTAINAGGGRSLPIEEDARSLVRLAREVYSEVDEPTEPPEPGEETGATAAEHPLDWRDSLWVDEEDPAAS